MRAPNPLNIRRIDHVVLRVRHMEPMIDFYCDVLGCRLERGPGTNGLAQLRAGDALIDLLDIDNPIVGDRDAAPSAAGANMDHVCLLVSPWDAQTIVRHLESAGVPVGDVAERYGADGMGPSIYLRDPEGNTVELKGPA